MTNIPVNLGVGSAHPIKTAKTKLIKLSICPCGFTLLRDEIELGTEFIVYPDSVRPKEPFYFLCGGCGKTWHGVGAIMANCITYPNALPSLLPLEILEIGLDYVDEVEVSV